MNILRDFLSYFYRFPSIFNQSIHLFVYKSTVKWTLPPPPRWTVAQIHLEVAKTLFVTTPTQPQLNSNGLTKK